MKTVVFDIETDGLNPSVIWCLVCKELDGDIKYWDINSGYEDFLEYSETVDRWVAHNGINFDMPVVNRLIGECIPFEKLVDTFIVSRLVNYSNYNGHGLDEIGASLGKRKTLFSDWSKYTPEMLEYCKDDVELGEKIYKHYRKFIDDPDWKDSLDCEHKISLICYQMNRDGFFFNRELALEVLPQIITRMKTLEETFQVIWPPELKEVGRLKYRMKEDGSLYKTVEKAQENYPKTEVDYGSSELVCFDYASFNPASSKDRVEKLWESGWEPTEKTKTHYKFGLKARVGEYWGKTLLTPDEFEKKKNHFEFYGWTVSEENLLTLPSDAPEGSGMLAEWLTLNGRLKALEERLRECEEDGRIRTNFWHIGAWTHRMSHSSPNLANISSPFHGEPTNGVEEVKKKYDADMRKMFTVPEGSYLVGTDAESIQLRILAHYLKNEDYVNAIISGRKEDGTDIHNLNRSALSLSHLTRDHAKTFIYAWLLGAGTGKVSRILGCNLQSAKKSVESFINSTTGLGELKRGLIKRDAARGYFEGLDGRKVINPSEYLMLAGYLQNGESVIMKHSNILWQEWAKEEKISFKQVNFVHDEWQTEVNDSLDAAERLGELQCKSLVETGKKLNLFCPLGGETNIGTTWLDTH